MKLGLMEDPPTITTATKRSEQQTSVTSRVKRDCISFFVSLQEGFRYFKALLVGQVLVTPSTHNSLVISHIYAHTRMCGIITMTAAGEEDDSKKREGSNSS